MYNRSSMMKAWRKRVVFQGLTPGCLVWQLDLPFQLILCLRLTIPRDRSLYRKFKFTAVGNRLYQNYTEEIGYDESNKPSEAAQSGTSIAATKALALALAINDPLGVTVNHAVL